MYTLFMSLCGGVSWEVAAVHTEAMGWPYFLVFVFYIFFTFFSILNIVTGVRKTNQGETNQGTAAQAKIRQPLFRSLLRPLGL